MVTNEFLHALPGSDDKDKLHPTSVSTFLRRSEASAYVRRQWNFPCSNAWLAKLAVIGGGPIFRKAGRYPIYAIQDLDSWAKSRISGPLNSTSEYLLEGE